MNKPDLKIFREKGVEVLNLNGLKTKTANELEAQNPGFLFVASFDDTTLHGYYVIHEYYAANVVSWYNACKLENPSSNFYFYIYLDGYDHDDSINKYLETIAASHCG